MTSQPADVFFSYDEVDLEHVRQIYDQLKQVGIQSWLADIDLERKASWNIVIEKALSQTKVIALFIGHGESDRHFRQLRRRFRPKLPVIVVVLPKDGSLRRPSNGFLQRFMNNTVIPFHSMDDDRALSNLIRAITQTIDRNTKPGLEINATVSYRKVQVPYFEETLPKSTNLKNIKVAGSTFIMGSPTKEFGRNNSNEGPQHEVSIPSFFMSKYAVTRRQWREVSTLPIINIELPYDPSSTYTAAQDDSPVEQITWIEAVEFCDRLSAHTGKHYTLPTEAQWEYACRAGTQTPFHFGETITTEVANYSIEGFSDGLDPNPQERSVPVAVTHFGLANNFGLCDMHGNVAEWCQDAWSENYEKAPTDGSAQISDSEEVQFVIRGGSYLSSQTDCRSAARDKAWPDERSDQIGFRVCCTLSSATVPDDFEFSMGDRWIGPQEVKQQSNILNQWMEEWGNIPEAGDEVLEISRSVPEGRKVIVNRQDEGNIATFWIVRPNENFERMVEITDLRPFFEDRDPPSGTGKAGNPQTPSGRSFTSQRGPRPTRSNRRKKGRNT